MYIPRFTIPQNDSRKHAIRLYKILGWHHPHSRDEGPAALGFQKKKDIFANAQEVSTKILLHLFLHLNKFMKIKPCESLYRGSQLASLKKEEIQGDVHYLQHQATWDTKFCLQSEQKWYVKGREVTARLVSWEALISWKPCQILRLLSPR